MVRWLLFVPARLRQSQQIQSRTAHFAAVGQILLGVLPDVFY